MNCRIGVDGGATKTELILVDAAGAVAARHSAPGCNPSHLGPAKAGEIVRTALVCLVAERASVSPVSTTLLCMAGNREFWREFARSLSGFGRVVAVDDSLPILEIATGGEPGIVLHGGTGSFVAARTAPPGADLLAGVAYAGGLGWLFEDPGSGYDLGRRAVGRALLELQGWLPASGLGPFVRAHTGRDDAGAISRYFYDPTTRGDIASLAPDVLRLAAEGDPAARAALADSAGGLLQLALDVAAKLFPRTPLAEIRAGLSGPILTHPAAVKILSERSPLVLKPIAEPPIEGVRRILQRYFTVI